MIEKRRIEWNVCKTSVIISISSQTQESTYLTELIQRTLDKVYIKDLHKK